MRILQVGFFAAGMVGFAGSAVGQTAGQAPDERQVVAQQMLGGVVPPTDSRDRVPGLSAFQLRALSRSETPPEISGKAAGQASAAPEIPAATRAQLEERLRAQVAEMQRAPRLGMVKQPPVCYSMRNYQVEQVTAGSDATRVTGYTECLPATEAQERGAVVRGAGPGLTR